jgi:hypothetical protein
MFIIQFLIAHYKPFLLVFLAVLWGSIAYTVGYAKSTSEWNKKYNLAQLNRDTEIRKIEHNAIKAQRDIESQYIRELNEYEKNNKILEYQLSDTISNCNERMLDNNKPTKDTGTGLSGNTRNQSNTVCYTRSELRKKIERSMAIARECDKEMIRFKALIKACTDGQKTR